MFFSTYKKERHKNRLEWIFINYPMVYKLVEDQGLSYEGWRALYKELRK